MSLQDIILFMCYSLIVVISAKIFSNKANLSDGENEKGTDFSIYFASFVWVLAVFFKSTIMDLLGTKPVDEIVHLETGNEIASRMSSGDWSLGDDGIIFGNSFFRYFLGVCSYVFDSKNGFASLLIISFLCFYGSLRLVIFSIAQTGIIRPHTVVVILAMALPSLLFWGISNLKEGLMYWSICMTLVKTMEVLSESETSPPKISSILSLSLVVLIGCALRPYVMIIWLVALSYLLLFSRYRVVVVPAFVSFITAAFFVLEKLSGFDSSMESALAMLDSNRESIISLDGSSIQGEKIFLISGIVSMFFRPFIWSTNGIQQFLSSLETWSIAIFIVYQLARVGGSGLRVLAKNTQFISCALALVGFCLLFTWSGNEGLLVRQRTQAVPALVMICMYLMSVGDMKISKETV